MNNRVKALISLLVLEFAYLIIRYPLFDLHGMIQWPLYLNIAGAAIIVVSIMVGKNITPAFTASGYILGFALGYLFEISSNSNANQATSNLWQIWLLVFVVAIFIGVNIEVKKERNRIRKLEKEQIKKLEKEQTQKHKIGEEKIRTK